MKIKYEFVNGDVVEIEVEDSIGTLILEMDRRERLDNRKETRRHEYLDLHMNESPWLKSGEEDPEEETVKKFLKQEIENAMDHLTEKQKETFIAIYYSGYSISEFARMKGLNRSVVSRRLAAAEKNLKKFL